MSLMHHGTTAQTMYPEGACHWLVKQKQVLGFLVGRALAQSPDRSPGRPQQPGAGKKKLGKKPRRMEHDVHE